MSTGHQATPAPRGTDEADTSSTGVIRSRLAEGRPASRKANFIFATGLALTGVLSGTGTTASIAESPARYIGDWTSTGRVVGSGPPGGAPSSRGRSEEIAPPSSTAEHGPTQAIEVGGSVEQATQAAKVRWLHDASGLTWEQLGRLFGVSRRAVHLWANGGRMNATNAEGLAELVALVRELPGGPDERRAALLVPSMGGGSIVDQIRARHRSGSRDISGTPFGPDELLGALHEDTATT
jgi:hypothetical protein